MDIGGWYFSGLDCVVLGVALVISRSILVSVDFLEFASVDFERFSGFISSAKNKFLYTAFTRDKEL